MKTSILSSSASSKEHGGWNMSPEASHADKPLIDRAFEWLIARGFEGTKADVMKMLPRAMSMATETGADTLRAASVNPAPSPQSLDIRAFQERGSWEMYLILYLLSGAGLFYGFGRFIGAIPPLKEWFKKK